MLDRDSIWVVAHSLDVAEVELDRLRNEVPILEQASIARYHTEALRRRNLASKAFLRRTLGQVLAKDPREIMFAFGDAGKPRLQEDNGWHFNLSHSDSVMVMALAWKCEIGIDVEVANPDLDFTEIADAYFTPSERARVFEAPLENRMLRFYETWTTKEAWLKYLGVGLSNELKKEIPSHSRIRSFRIENSGITCGALAIDRACSRNISTLPSGLPIVFS